MSKTIKNEIKLKIDKEHGHYFWELYLDDRYFAANWIGGEEDLKRFTDKHDLKFKEDR